MRNVVVSPTELRELRRYQASTSCRERLKTGDNLLVLNLAPHSKTLVVLPSKATKPVSVSGSVDALVDCVTSHKNAGSNVRSHGAFLDAPIIKLRFRTRPFRSLTLNLAGRLGGVYEKMPFVRFQST